VAYQVLARKYRPQRFADVVGQQGVTQTLRNAIATGRLAHAYIFAGPRGVGKTTTARILAKALNCFEGPTPEPCNRCDACVEIAEGRDIDVVEIDAATHTQVDTVREVIIAGLAVRPVRDRYKIFIIDEVHQLSSHSFNALLKSVEEPPPHVVFLMATTELQKIPDTIRSRSQEFEFRTISARAIATALAAIAEQERLTVEPAALALIARAAEGSLRDAESSFDQVIAFAGDTITAADVTAVLGLIGRDLLLDIVETVADEDAPRVFDVVGRAVESGQDLRLLCRELSRIVRDMMLVKIDPARAAEPDFAGAGDVDRLKSLAARFSREDLLRAFDVVARAEVDVRTSAQPRYHVEMALLKWIHLGKLQPLGDVIQAFSRGGGPAAAPSRGARAPGDVPLTRGMAPGGTAMARPEGSAPLSRVPMAEPPALSRDDAGRTLLRSGAAAPSAVAPNAGSITNVVHAAVGPPATPFDAVSFRERFFEQIRQKKKLLHGTVVAQAHRVEIADDVVTFCFGPQHRILRRQVEDNRGVLEQIASDVAGRRMSVRAAELEVTPPSAASAGNGAGADQARTRLRERALADSAVQAMLEVFPAEITDVEEIDG
jgi:DNA polymerase-3 subunit gamma/tau